MENSAIFISFQKIPLLKNAPQQPFNEKQLYNNASFPAILNMSCNVPSKVAWD